MNDRDDGLDESEAAISRDIALAFDFLGELIDNPIKVDQIPGAATIFVAPADDPTTAARRLADARRASEVNDFVYLWRLGRLAGERSIDHVRTIHPMWPQEGIDPIGLYDRGADLLIVDFFKGQRQGAGPIETPGYGQIWVDLTTEEVVVNVLPRFLAVLVRRDPTLIDVLLRPETQLVGISPSEVEALRLMLLGERAARADIVPFAAITERLRLQTA